MEPERAPGGGAESDDRLQQRRGAKPVIYGDAQLPIGRVEPFLGMYPSICIIGCGISGVAAADRLVKAGFSHVRIVEATGRSGGRIQTTKLGEQLLSTECQNNSGPFGFSLQDNFQRQYEHPGGVVKTGCCDVRFFSTIPARLAFLY